MTQNQIAYQTYLETARSNRAKEQETTRSNVTKEIETARHNRAQERDTDAQRSLSSRLGFADLELRNQSLAETKRHNLEAERNERYRTDIQLYSAMSKTMNDSTNTIVKTIDAFIPF